MAEKGFGVKEVNLIGASGTPTITSPNNLNLNAVNVAISTNATVGGTLSVTGNVSVGGTLTYEDVTSIDSIGIVTAREGVFIPDNKTLKIGNTASNPDFIFYHDGTSTILTNNMNGTTGAIVIQPKSGEDGIKIFPDGAAELYFNSNKKLETSNTGVTVTGTLTATTFSGSGASLTSLPAANLTGTLPAISGANLTNLPATDPTNTDIQVVYTVTANGSSAYRFAGNGVVSTADDPDLYLIRGQKYRFINNSGGSHPFQIREASGGTAYSTGVTNNGAASANIDFAPTYDSPAQLVYQCTSHGGMVGNIYLRDAAGNNTNVGVTTFTDTLVVKGSGGGTLKVTGSSAHTSKIVIADNGGTANGNCLVEGGDGTDFFTIQSNGNVQFPNGKGINFGASAGGNASSSILDDYEEGTWTPNFSGLTASNTSNNCFYTKIGNLVNAQFRATMPSSSSASSATIAGLPFTIINSGGQGVPGGAFSETNAGENLSMIGNPNTTNMYVLRCDSSGVAVVSLSNISGKDFRGSITYRVS